MMNAPEKSDKYRDIWTRRELDVCEDVLWRHGNCCDCKRTGKNGGALPSLDGSEKGQPVAEK